MFFNDYLSEIEPQAGIEADHDRLVCPYALGLVGREVVSDARIYIESQYARELELDTESSADGVLKLLHMLIAYDVRGCEQGILAGQAVFGFAETIYIQLEYVGAEHVVVETERDADVVKAVGHVAGFLDLLAGDG